MCISDRARGLLDNRLARLSVSAMPHPAAMRQLAQCDLQRFTSRFNSRARPSRDTHSLFPASPRCSPRLDCWTSSHRSAIQKPGGCYGRPS